MPDDATYMRDDDYLHAGCCPLTCGMLITYMRDVAILHGGIALAEWLGFAVFNRDLSPKPRRVVTNHYFTAERG